MFKIGDLVIHNMFGYLAIVIEITNHDQFPYVIHYISEPHEDDDDFFKTEHCCETEIKLLDSEEEKG